MLYEYIQDKKKTPIKTGGVVNAQRGGKTNLSEILEISPSSGEKEGMARQKQQKNKNFIV